MKAKNIMLIAFSLSAFLLVMGVLWTRYEAIGFGVFGFILSIYMHFKIVDYSSDNELQKLTEVSS